VTEDPHIIRLNIRHYKELLKLYCTEETRQQILEMLARAQEQLPLAMSEALERQR
jgi:hypothetical protein